MFYFYLSVNKVNLILKRVKIEINFSFCHQNYITRSHKYLNFYNFLRIFINIVTILEVFCLYIILLVVINIYICDFKNKNEITSISHLSAILWMSIHLSEEYTEVLSLAGHWLMLEIPWSSQWMWSCSLQCIPVSLLPSILLRLHLYNLGDGTQFVPMSLKIF